MRERLLAIGGDLTMAALSEIRGRPSATQPWIRGWPSCAVTVTGLAFSPHARIGVPPAPSPFVCSSQRSRSSLVWGAVSC